MNYPGLILKNIHYFEGKTRYQLIKELSRNHKIAKSTIKYNINKLINKGLIKLNEQKLIMNNELSDVK